MASFDILTKGHNDIVNITDQVKEQIALLGKTDGLLHVFLPSTTSALTIMEYEEGAISDLKETLDRLIPEHQEYKHNAKWGDMNGYAHVREALMKPFLSVPLINGELALGTWQSIVLIDFDNQERSRTIHVNIYS